MKIVKINESQRKRLFEKYDEDFSFETLSVVGRGQFAGEDHTDRQIEYCKKYLGDPIDIGSSRVVFQLDDNFVIKLSINYDGFMQNEREYKVYLAANSELFTKVLYCADDYSYIVSEYALPATPSDIEKILGIPYSDVYQQRTKNKKDMFSKNGGDIEIGFDKYFDNLKPYGQESEVSFVGLIKYLSNKISDKKLVRKYNAIIKSNPWFRKFIDLVNNYKLDVYDLLIGNLGMVNRNGKPMIVILDSGLNDNEEYEFENNY
jgi:hypothetical protein